MRYFILIFLMLPSFLFSQSRQILPDRQKITQLLESNNIILESPIILENAILFFYRGKAKKVALAGDFNQWQGNTLFKETKPDLWVYSWTNRLPTNSYKYRIKVDDFWIADPSNPNYKIDAGQEVLSILTLTKDFIPNKKYPLWISNNNYLFRHYNTNANAVSIVGDFNNWNPFSHQMKYIGAGQYEIELDLDPEILYLYAFVVDGLWTFDENNKQQYRNEQNRPVSAFFANTTNSKP